MWINGRAGLQTQTANLRVYTHFVSKAHSIISTLGGKTGKLFPVMKQEEN